MNKILFPSCSEYVNHITLTYDEVLFVKKLISIIDSRKIENEASIDEKHILEHFGYTDTPNDGDCLLAEGEGIGFIETDLCKDYEHLRDLINSIRKDKLTKEQALKRV
jgi:hypothetical protein